MGDDDKVLKKRWGLDGASDLPVLNFVNPPHTLPSYILFVSPLPSNDLHGKGGGRTSVGGKVKRESGAYLWSRDFFQVFRLIS